MTAPISADRPFIPRVFISPYGSVAIEEPDRTDTYRVVWIGPDVVSVTMCDQRGQVRMPAEFLVGRMHFREMVPRDY